MRSELQREADLQWARDVARVIRENRGKKESNMSIAEDIYNGEICQFCFGEIEDNNIHKSLGYPISCKECSKEGEKS